MNLAERLLQSAAQNSDRTAIIFRDREISYGEVAGQVLAAARSFAAMGVGRGDAVMLIMRNCPEFVVSYLALSRIGAITAPMNPAASPHEVTAAAQSSGAVGIIAQARYLENAAEACSRETVRFTIVADGPCTSPDQIPFDKLLSPPEGAPLPEGPSDDDIAALLFTSGVTGQSKAVMLSHRNVLSNGESCVEVFHCSPEDRCLTVLPMFHVFCWTVCVVMLMLSGGAIVIVESVQPFSEVLAACARHGVTVFIGVPAIFAAVVKTPGLTLEKLGGRVRWALSGAAPLAVQVQRGFEEKFGIPLIQGYGLTEASPVVSTNPPHGMRKHGSIGPPIPNVSVQIRSEDGTVLGPGEIGELVAKGPNVMLGYRNDPEGTAAAFTEDGRLRTGDLGSIDEDGYIFLVDRAKDLVIVKGLNVYPREVEEVLLEHPSVADAAVIGVPDHTGDETLRAYVVLKEGASATPDELLGLFKDRLARYKTPRAVIVLDQMPTNTLGKTLKRVLREQAREEIAGGRCG